MGRGREEYFREKGLFHLRSFGKKKQVSAEKLKEAPNCWSAVLGGREQRKGGRSTSKGSDYKRLHWPRPVV